MERNNKQKSQLNRVERPEGGAPFCDKSKAQQEEEGLLFFPGKDSANEKLRTLHLLQSSQLFFFSSLSRHSLLAMWGVASGSWWQTPRCNSLLILNLSLLKKYLLVYLFQINTINIIHEEKQMHHSETSSILLSGREKFPFLSLLNSCTRMNNKTDTRQINRRKRNKF